MSSCSTKHAIICTSIEEIECAIVLVSWLLSTCIHIDSSQQVHQIASCWLLFFCFFLWAFIPRIPSEIEIKLVVFFFLRSILWLYNITSEVKIIRVISADSLAGSELLKSTSKVEFATLVLPLALSLNIFDSLLFFAGGSLLGCLDSLPQLFIFVHFPGSRGNSLAISLLSPLLPFSFLLDPAGLLVGGLIGLTAHVVSPEVLTRKLYYKEYFLEIIQVNQSVYKKSTKGQRSLTVLVEVLEGLVINPQLKLVTMLNHAEAVLSYGEWEQECPLVPKKFIKDLVRPLVDYLRIILVDYLLVLKNLLLS